MSCGREKCLFGSSDIDGGPVPHIPGMDAPQHANQQLGIPIGLLDGKVGSGADFRQLPDRRGDSTIALH